MLSMPSGLAIAGLIIAGAIAVVAAVLWDTDFSDW